MLRARLIAWYSVLVLVTVVSIGVVQRLIIQRSLLDSLDNSLIEDSRATLSLISSLSTTADPEHVLEHSRMHTTGTLRDVIDNVLAEIPDTLKGEQLTDRVVTHLIDEILSELSFDDSSGHTADPLDAVVQRSISGRRNNFVE